MIGRTASLPCLQPRRVAVERERGQKGTERVTVYGASSRESYRSFRGRVLQRVEKDDRPAYSTYRRDDDDETERRHPLHELRRRVVALREHLYWRHGDDHGLGEEPGAEVRRALGIPHDVRLSYPLSTRLLQGAAGFVVPAHLMLKIARRQLQRVRSYHGRRLLFSAVLRRFFLTGRDLSLTDALDFALRHLEGWVTHEQLRALQDKNAHWLRALYKLGRRTAPGLLEFFRQRRDPDDGPLVEILVEERVIQAPEELTPWPERPHYLQGRARVESHQLGAARAVVRRLVQLGVPRAAIAKACEDAEPSFRPARLEANLAVLAEHGVDVSMVAAGVGKLLWTALPAQWRFLFDALRLHTAEDLVLFTELLERQSEPNAELAHALAAMGSTAQGLADCQHVLLLDANANDRSAAVRALERLSRPPFSFSVSEFGRVRDYARDGGNLEAFLAHLARHGLVAPNEVLALERCYRHVSLDSLGRLLDVGVPRRGSAAVDELSEWVLRAARVGQADACQAAADLLRLSGLPDLERLLTVAPLGTSVLRYLVVDKRLHSLGKLVDWFYNDAPGVLELKLRGPLDEFDRLVLDDAFERRRFNLVNHNVRCAYAAGRHRAAAQLGPAPVAYEDQAAWQAYDRALHELIDAQRPALLQRVRDVLALTGGVLLISLLDAESGEDAQERLARVAPLLDELVAGRGPAASQLSELEAEAVALVYGATPDAIGHLWPALVGREQDLAVLTLADHYPMCWRRTHRRLRDGERLDAEGLSTFARLPALTKEFNGHWTTDMFRACKGLRPRRFADSAADVQGLAHHLAVLCAIASGDEQVAATLRRWEESQNGLLAGSVPYAELEHLQAFFETILPDALDAQAPIRLRRLDREAAAFLVQRLGADVPPGIESDRDRLGHAITAARTRVLQVYAKWSTRECSKFPKVGDKHAGTPLRAVVSKSPAAFFAKETVGLCTRHDVGMWKEARHSHLLVFDAAQKCLAGMAMLYVEIVPVIDADRPTLVIRALNPVARFAAQHDISTIVDAFFATAMTIAADNDLAAVAFPGAGGMHLLSNVPEVERDILKRYVKPARNHSGFKARRPEQQGPLDRPLQVEATFHGYAVGGGTVSSLYVIWQWAERVAAQPQP